MLQKVEVRPLDAEELRFKKKALKDALICMGWLKMTSITCYILIYFLVYASSKGEISMILQVMVLMAVPAQILHGSLLFLGAIEEKILALEVALWLCLLLASYNTVLGVTGALYFIRTGHLTMHFLLAATFTLLAFSLCTVICHDILIIFTYKQLLKHPPENV